MTNDVGEPSGPAGVFMRGRTLYVAIGVGDVGRAGPLPGTTVPNPNPLSSPIFSSILAIHFSAHVESTTSGFALSLADHQTLAGGEPVRISYGRGETVTIEPVADFKDFVPNPLPFFASNVQLSNPFDLVAVADRLYVLQHVSGAPGPPVLSGPGILFLFDTPGQAPQTIANCLNRATSRTLDERTDTLYITELAGRIVAIPLHR